MADNWHQSGAQTSVVETIALLLIIGLGFWFLVRPQMGVLSKERGILNQAKQENQQVDQDKQKLAELVARLQKSQNDLKLVDEAIPLQNRPTQMEYLINDMVTASGMSLADLNLQVSETGAVPVAGNKTMLQEPFNVQRKLQTTNLDLTVKGGVDQFENLLKLLETNGRIIDVASLDMTNEEEAPSFRLKLKMYSYAP